DHYFKLYQKARRGRQEIEKKLANINREKQRLGDLLGKVDTVSSTDDLLRVREIIEPKSRSPKTRQKKKASEPRVAGARSYLSKDGYEILVGRSSQDNDNLTFKI